MQKWEYFMAECHREKKEWTYIAGGKKYANWEQMVDALGASGWELVGVSTFVWTEYGGYPHTSGEYFYFKRPIE